MIGDFQYYSSSSEESNSEYESDSSDSEGGLEKLVAERKILQDKIQSYEKKLMYIQKTLKSLNEERKNLLEMRNQLISSISEDAPSSNQSLQTVPSSTLVLNDDENDRSENTNNSLSITTNSVPLNLDVTEFMKSDNDEEFDSEEDL